MSRHALKTTTALASTCILLLTASQAFAAQGPGIADGTASAMTQIGMSVLVYGTSALVVAVGLIGAVRHR